MNRNIIMYYDSGCIRICKSFVKMEEDIHISSLASYQTTTGKSCLCIAKSNEQLLNSKFYKVIPNEDSTISRESGLLTVNTVGKTSKQGKFSVFLISRTNELIWLRKGSTIGKIEEVKECNFVNINNPNL